MDTIKTIIDSGFAGIAVLLLYLVYSETKEIINLLKFMIETNTEGIHRLADEINKLNKALGKRPCLYKEEL